MDKRIKYGLFLLLLLSFFYPFLSWRPLHGYFMKPKFPIFSFDGLLTGVYQDQLTKYVDGNIESRPFTVRMKNQVDFWMFNKICNKNFSQGENHFFYENAYIQAYNGTDFIGEDSIKNIVDNLAELKLSAEKHNKKVIVVLTPNKARCVSENIPKPFRYEGANTNYKSCRKLLSESQIPFFDVSQFFLNMKDTSEYPLFSKNGTHWGW